MCSPTRHPLAQVVYLYLVVGTLSIAGALIVLGLYWSNAALRAHPSPIIFWVTVGCSVLGARWRVLCVFTWPARRCVSCSCR